MYKHGNVQHIFHKSGGNLSLNPFTHRCFLTPLQQTTFEIIVAKEEVTLFAKMFLALFLERDFQYFSSDISKDSAADLLFI